MIAQIVISAPNKEETYSEGGNVETLLSSEQKKGACGRALRITQLLLCQAQVHIWTPKKAAHSLRH